MAQQFPTTAQVIYDVLAADATFAGYLGSYEFNSSGAVPAMSIVTPGADLPALRKVSGIEVVIHDTGNTERYEYLTGEAARVRTEWAVFLICWKPATGSELQVATNRLMEHFGGSSSMQTVAVADGLGAMVQTKVMIRSDMPVLEV